MGAGGAIQFPGRLHAGGERTGLSVATPRAGRRRDRERRRRTSLAVGPKADCRIRLWMYLPAVGKLLVPGHFLVFIYRAMLPSNAGKPIQAVDGEIFAYICRQSNLCGPTSPVHRPSRRVLSQAPIRL